MSESAALEKSGILKSVAGSLGDSNLGISSLGTLKEGGENDGDGAAAAFGAAAGGGGAGGGGVAVAAFFSSLPPPPPNSDDDPKDGPVHDGGAAGALGAFFVAAL